MYWTLKEIWSAVCFIVPHSQDADGALPHLYRQGAARIFLRGGAEVMEAKALKTKNYW